LDWYGSIDEELRAGDRPVGKTSAQFDRLQTINDLRGIFGLDTQDKVVPEEVQVLHLVAALSASPLPSSQAV
jgi:hypothetical protein